MTHISKVVALGAAVVGVALCPALFAQDDLEDLLKDLEAETEAVAAPVAEEAAEAPAEAETEEPAVEEPAAEEPAAEEPAAEEAEAEEEPAAEEPAAEEAEAEEEPAAEAAEEPAEEPAAEEATEEPATEEPAAEEPVAEEPATEEPAAEEPAPAPAAAEKPTEEKVDEAISLLDAIAEESEVGAPAESPAAEAPKPAVKQSPDAELISNIVTTERMRRQALDAQARRSINEARSCMKSSEYTDAVRCYGNALKLLGDRQAVKDLRKECEQGIAEGLYRAAIQEHKLGRRENAIKLMEKAIEMRHPRARRMLEKWNEENVGASSSADDSEIRHRKNDEDFKKEREQIRKRLRRARQYLSLRDMDKALEECEIVLVNDPYNEEAIRIRKAIQQKRKLILKKEREAAREGMIADVDQAWRPVYAVNAAKLNEQTAETLKKNAGEDPERTIEQEIERRMKEMIIPNISFKSPATIIEAVEFFRQASKDFDRPEIPAEKRGFNFVLRLPQGSLNTQAVAEEEDSDDFSSNGGDEGPSGPTNGLEPIATITASDITFYEALKLVTDSVQYKFVVNGKVIMVMPKDMSTAECISRKYNVPEAFVERVSNAKEEMKSMGSGGFGSSSRKGDDASESEEQDWKTFFEEMGVIWPEGSSIKHIKALGKLYVRNTRENLAVFEKVLDELGAQTPLIEIETRFVEVSQEDLNSLGFEWLLNSDYSLNLGDQLGKALGVRDSTWGTTKGSESWKNNLTVNDNGTMRGDKKIPGLTSGTTYDNHYVNSSEKTINPYSSGGNLIRNDGSGRNIGINAFGGDSDYQNGNRYLSTMGNPISGQGNWTNDQFMRVNAFLGNADLSMILHMLSQRSDTDLLSAPKIVTRSGENAVIKVVTEFIYPQDYDVQLQSSSSGGSNNSSSQSAVLAIVEPQNFTMREVGVILDVTPVYNESNGGTIDLELKPQVVDEPTWKNYGMKIPFTGNSSLQNFEGIGGIFDGLANSIKAVGEIPADVKNWIITTETQAAEDALAGLTRSSSDNMTYYEAPMEQPFFHVRSIDSKVSITPGSTVVMGGLITEARKAMDDKVPFLGDLPFIGRLFRSHAEQTLKRNLLIFVTGRLITPSGRELKMAEVQSSDDAEVKAAPEAE